MTEKYTPEKVPDLGPEHCHLCSERNGSETPWDECSSRAAVPAVTDEMVLAALNAYNQGLNLRMQPAPALTDEDGDFYSLDQQDAMIAALEAALGGTE